MKGMLLGIGFTLASSVALGSNPEYAMVSCTAKSEVKGSPFPSKLDWYVDPFVLAEVTPEQEKTGVPGHLVAEVFTTYTSTDKMLVATKIFGLSPTKNPNVTVVTNFEITNLVIGNSDSYKLAFPVNKETGKFPGVMINIKHPDIKIQYDCKANGK